MFYPQIMNDPCQPDRISLLSGSISVVFLKPVTELQTVVPDLVIRALFTHRQYRVDAIHTHAVNGPVFAAELLLFGIQLITPMIIKLVIEMQLEILDWEKGTIMGKYRYSDTHKYFSLMGQVYPYSDSTIAAIFLEEFDNGNKIGSFYLNYAQ